MSKILKSGLLLSVGVLLGVVVMTVKYEAAGGKIERLAQNDEMLDCPTGSAARWERWGGPVKQGWVHYCQMNHGPYRVWVDNQLYIDGQFQFGEKAGDWSIKTGDDDKVLRQKYEPATPAPTVGNGDVE